MKSGRLGYLDGVGRIREGIGLALVVAAIAASLIIGPRFAGDPYKSEPPLPPQALGAHSCAGSQLEPAEIESFRARAAVLCLINEERAAERLPALSKEPRLERAAIEYARLMRERDFFAHEGPDGSTPHSRILAAGYPQDAAGGENLAWGQREASTPSAIVRGWMESEGHRKNILRPQFKYIGIGIVRGSPRHGQSDDESAIYVTPFGG